jgi:carboxylesterase
VGRDTIGADGARGSPDASSRPDDYADDRPDDPAHDDLRRGDRVPSTLTEPWSAPGVPREHDGRRVGVLVLHGFTGSPASVRPWAAHLHEAGFAVSVPRLPGHGTRWQDLNRTTYADWYSEAETAFEKLTSECDEVVVAGLSMGGCLALDIAERRSRDVAGLVLVNPIVNSERRDLRLLPLLKHVVPALPGIRNDIKKADVDEVGYPRTPLRAAHSMFQAVKVVRARLPEVTQPLLLFRSRTDRVVDPSSGRIILSTVSSRDLEERVLEDSYHVATLDNDAPAVFDGTVAFVRRVTDDARPTGSAA